MEGFFQGLEHSSAFAFVQNETREFVKRKRTDYKLYEGNIYPFVEFGDQLRALNDYCFLVAQAVQEELLEKQSQLSHSKSCPEEELCWLAPFTRTELLLGMEDQQAQWEWAACISAAHLVMLSMPFWKGRCGRFTNGFARKNSSVKNSRSKILRYTVGFISCWIWMRIPSVNNIHRCFSAWNSAAASATILLIRAWREEADRYGIICG